MKKITSFVNSVLEQKISLIFWFLNFIGVISVRLYLDKFIALSRLPLFDLIMDIHNLLFFFLSFAFVWLSLSLILKKTPFELAYLMLWSSLAIVFPPIFDLIRTGGGVFWSFYLISAPQDLFWQYVTIFGHLPSGIVYFGTKITFVIGILSLVGLVFVKTKKFSKIILTAFFAYSGLFLMAAFPSLYYYLVAIISGKNIFSLQPFEIIQFFANTKFFAIELSESIYALVYNLNLVYFPLVVTILGYFFWKSKPEAFKAFMRNLRYPQVIFHIGLLFFGFGVGLITYPENFNLNPISFLALFNVLISVFLAWEASVVVNDIFDYEVDLISNPERPLQKSFFSINQYAQFGVVLFALSIIGSLMVHYKFGVLLFIYQVLAWFYSAAPYRLKRFPLVASFVSALTLLTIFFSGFIFFSPEQNIDRLSWRIIFLLVTTYTLSLPIKDFKDIEGDRKDGIRTIPVIFGEKRGRELVASGIFLSFILSIFFINEFRLFWWAIIFGAISFWVMVNDKIHPRKLYVWILPLITAYGFLAVKIIFFSR